MIQRTVSVPIPDKFKPLAEYSAEVARGLVHTLEYERKMNILQREFEDWKLRPTQHKDNRVIIADE